jgi:tryptophan synthase alpha chain
MAFMPFITAGDPDMDGTCKLIRELADREVDMIEIGFPYSDPIADGPIIQASYTRALNQGFHVADLFDAIRSLTTDPNSPVTVPLVAMVSYAIIFRWGRERFLEHAKQAGFAGLIVPDLPGDEGADFVEMVRQTELDLVQLISPTTLPERAEHILESCTGFVYCISVAGTTGVRSQLPAELQTQMRELRTKTDLPLVVGFGVNTPEQIDALREFADGAIIGSGIVRHLEPIADGTQTLDEAVQHIGEFAAKMVAAAHQS